MILTEEQRAAIKIAIRYIPCWPSACKERYAKEVLQAMIDSSGTVEPTGGFDLEMARAEVATASARMLSESREQARIFCAEEILPDALAEIERLRANVIAANHSEVIDQQAAKIRELEDALVEGLTNFLYYRASCYDPARRCPYAKECDDCSTWDACGHVEKFRSEARQLLQAEGKIGSSDHSSDVTKKVWQITEKRKDALGVILARIEYDQSQPGRFNYTISRAKDTLRTMLKEAEQCE